MGPGRGRAGGPWGGTPWGNFWGFGAEAGPGFKWKFFDRGDLKFVILRLLDRKPMHGYEVMRALEEESGGCYRASAGSVYPTLQMLEDQGFVASSEEDGKKIYRITEAGRKNLRENSDVVDEITERVSDFTNRYFRSEMRDLGRSFSRFAQIAFERTVKWPGDPDVVQQIKDIIERATHDLEGVRPRRSGESS
ncbi:MAG TPA: PadR family transcriptional regulator [Longimicrobiales bacterium]